MIEIWKYCLGGGYEVSNLGNVCIAGTEEFVRQQGKGNNYRRIYVLGSCFLVHRLVAEAFIGPCPEGKEVNHKDLNKGNNYYKNLEYKTHRKNLLHAVKNGVKFNPHPVSGDDNPCTKLTRKDRRRIRRLHRKYIKGNFASNRWEKNRKLTLQDLAEEYGVSNVLIQKVVYK